MCLKLVLVRFIFVSLAFLCLVWAECSHPIIWFSAKRQRKQQKTPSHHTRRLLQMHLEVGVCERKTRAFFVVLDNNDIRKDKIVGLSVTNTKVQVCSPFPLFSPFFLISLWRTVNVIDGHFSFCTTTEVRDHCCDTFDLFILWVGWQERVFNIKRDLNFDNNFPFCPCSHFLLVFLTFFRHTILPLKTLIGSKLSLTTSPASWRFSILPVRKNTPLWEISGSGTR